MNTRHLALHGLAIKRLASAAAVADLVGLPELTITDEFARAAATGRLTEAKGKYTLVPLARVALSASYGRHYGQVRHNPEFEAAYQRFEQINRSLKQIITDWQTVDVRGERVPNDHTDQAYDQRVIDRLGDVHTKVEPVLHALASVLPRLDVYLRKLAFALEKAEDGDNEWVSDVRCESYHTMWFELHEDLLRIMGTERDE